MSAEILMTALQLQIARRCESEDGRENCMQGDNDDNCNKRPTMSTQHFET